MINTEIGVVAGKVWNFLSEKGEMSLSRLKKEVEGGDTLVLLALGWLAKEEKVTFEKRANAIFVCLT